MGRRRISREQGQWWCGQMRDAIAGKPFLTHPPSDITYAADLDRRRHEEEIARQRGDSPDSKSMDPTNDVHRGCKFNN